MLGSNVGFEVSLDFLQFLDEVCFPSIFKALWISFIDPLERWTFKLFRVVIALKCIQTILLSPHLAFVFLHLPSGCVLGIGNVLLGLVIVFECNFLHISNFGIVGPLFSFDILSLFIISILKQLSLASMIWLNIHHWMSGVRGSYITEVFGVDHCASLHHETIWSSTSTRCFAVPGVVVFETLKKLTIK